MMRDVKRRRAGSGRLPTTAPNAFQEVLNNAMVMGEMPTWTATLSASTLAAIERVAHTPRSIAAPHRGGLRRVRRRSSNIDEPAGSDRGASRFKSSRAVR
jgi:hypothetical protein